MNEEKVVIVIPTFNNEKTLNDVINGCKEFSKNIIVVNDGSTDNTYSILQSQSDITCLNFEINRGKGQALKAALRYATKMGYDYAITIDSDSQHFPEEIPKFIEASNSEPQTLWIGSRNLAAENMPEKNTFANKFSNFWFKAETGTTLSDTQSGFRLYPLKPFQKMKFISGRYEFELEILVRAVWKGVPVKNLPIKVYYPPKGERVSHFRPFRDFTRISILNTILVLWALLWYWPLKFIKWFSKENIKNFIKENITHSKLSNFKIASSVGVGLFFGIAPFWGYQMVTAVVVAHMLKLNKTLALVSSNISLPPMIPFILYGSFAVGSYIFDIPISIIPHDLTLQSISHGLKQYIVGSFVLALLCGLAGFLLSYILLFIFRGARNE